MELHYNFEMLDHTAKNPFSTSMVETLGFLKPNLLHIIIEYSNWKKYFLAKILKYQVWLT
jgi:hypothetical protein